jgi:carbon storage regulator
MFKVKRRIGEKLCIGEDIKVVVIGHEDGQVHLGVAAPRSIAIDREEVRMKKRGHRSDPMTRKTR